MNAMRIPVVGLVLVCACGGSSSSEGPDASVGGSGSAGGSSDASVSTATCDGRAVQPKDSTWTLSVDGMQRTAKVHVPTSYDPSKRVPLVINVHGRTGSAAQQATITHAIAKSDAEGFVVIHPEATGSPTAWNAGGGCCGAAYEDNVDDSGFVAALIDEAAARLCLDADRVYMMGLSNGGYLSHRLACEHGDKIAAIGPVAGVLSLPGCAPARPMPMLIVHGTEDNIVQYSWEAPTVDFWVAKNGCTTETQSYKNGAATCITHGGCTDGADVVMCTVTGGGHQWHGGDAIPFLGTKSNDINTTDALWDFFVAHPRT